jgi:hypothetical protein
MEKLLSQRQQGLHTYDPPCPLHLARVMKAPTRPLSKKRAAEELLGRVHLARLYALWQAAGAARRPAHLPLWTTGLLRDCQDHKNEISVILHNYILVHEPFFT